MIASGYVLNFGGRPPGQADFFPWRPFRSPDGWKKPFGNLLCLPCPIEREKNNEMYNEILIEMGGSLTGEGRLPLSLEEAGKDMGPHFKTFIFRLNQMRQVYAKALADDGKMIGEERYLLLEVIDHAMEYLILIRSIAEGNSFFTCFDPKYNHRIRVDIDKNKWTVNGSLGQFRKVKVENFSAWIEGIEEKLRKTLEYIAKTGKDGHFDETEKSLLLQSIDRMILSFFLIRDQILSGEIG